jgi:hypothetical protein
MGRDDGTRCWFVRRCLCRAADGDNVLLASAGDLAHPGLRLMRRTCQQRIDGLLHIVYN